jgi:Rrf2 family protein
VAFSSKTDYGLVALIELGSAYPSGGVMQVAEIAARQSIPDRYLEQMLTTLRRGGILRSIRGPKGGYQLMRAPSEVLVADVVNCLEGESSAKDTPTRPTAEFQVLLELDQQLGAARQALLKSTSLQDLIDRRDAQSQEQAMYFI